MALWDDVKKNLVEWYTVTSEKTSEAARIGSRRWDKFGISRDIERQFSELGNLVYSGLKEGQEDILESEDFQSLVSRIETLEEELKLKDEEIETIRAEYRREARRAAEEAAAREAAGESEDDPESTSEEDTGDGDGTGSILKGPILDQGAEESAILVEPDEVADGREGQVVETAEPTPDAEVPTSDAEDGESGAPEDPDDGPNKEKKAE